MHEGRQGEVDRAIQLDVMQSYAPIYNLAHGKRVMDVGANIGFATCEFAKVAQSVISYEPEPTNFKLLLENTKNLANVTCVNAGVGPSNSIMTLYTAKKLNQGLHSLLRIPGRVPVEVQILDFQQLLEEHKPQILKFDAEGAEQLVSSVLSNLPQYVESIAIEFDVAPGRMERNGFHRDASMHLFNVIKAQFHTTLFEKVPPIHDAMARFRNGFFIGTRV